MFLSEDLQMGLVIKKKKKGPGKYPVKAAGIIKKLLESVESNAQFKGLNTSNLIIKHIKADFASRPWHFGRQRRRKMKRTNIEVVVEEVKTEGKGIKNSEKAKETGRESKDNQNPKDGNKMKGKEK